MLSNITWQGYWITLALLTTAYYVFVYLLYFRHEFKIPLSVSHSPVREDVTTNAPFSNPVALSQPELNATEDDLFSSPEPGSDEHTVYACMDELNAYFEEARKRKCLKKELLYAVQRILSKYSSLKTSQYKESVSNVIITEAEHICSIHLSADEVVGVWLDR